MWLLFEVIKVKGKQMIRVLQCVNDMHRAGLETMLMNYIEISIEQRSI